MAIEVKGVVKRLLWKETFFKFIHLFIFLGNIFVYCSDDVLPSGYWAINQAALLVQKYLFIYGSIKKKRFVRSAKSDVYPQGDWFNMLEKFS